MIERVKCAYDEMVDIHKIVENPRNANTHSKEQIDRLAKIIDFQGQRSPLVIDSKTQYLVKGHGRLLALKKLGWEKVAVDYQEYVSEAQMYADMIADNEIARWAEFNEAKFIEDVATMDIGDIELFGLKEIPDLLHEKKVELTDADEVPEVAQNVHGVVLGQIYKLGEHRLMCGDSTDLATVEKLMDGQKADMVFTDPPYGMFLETNYDQMFASDEKHRKTGDRFSLVKGDHEDFSPELINTIFACFSDCPEVFLWGADYYSELIPELKDGSWIVWDKRLNENMDKVSGNTFELCWSKKKHKRLIARIMWSGHHGMQKDDTKTRVHPTQKPSALIEWFFQNWGSAGDSVVDLFGGSGSTLIACEKTNRKCFMMELDPHYCSVIIERWQNFTGKKAELLNG